MGIGYVVGCLLSILLWKIDRQFLVCTIDKYIRRWVNSTVILQCIYLLAVSILVYLMIDIDYSEIVNGVTAFLIIDISNTERKNLQYREKVRFYDSISTISKSIVCGFVAPLFYIMALGNAYGILFSIVYNIRYASEEYLLFKWLFTIMSIIPSLVTEALLYIVYICRNRSLTIDFKGDYLQNIFFRPLLNVDIFGAYIESVNFYYCYVNSRNIDFIKSYGGYRKKIDDNCIRDYLGIGYGICLVIFILFFILVK